MQAKTAATTTRTRASEKERRKGARQFLFFSYCLAILFYIRRGRYLLHDMRHETIETHCSSNTAPSPTETSNIFSNFRDGPHHVMVSRQLDWRKTWTPWTSLTSSDSDKIIFPSPWIQNVSNVMNSFERQWCWEYTQPILRLEPLSPKEQQ